MCALDISGENTFENKKGFLPFPVKQSKMEIFFIFGQISAKKGV